MKLFAKRIGRKDLYEQYRKRSEIGPRRHARATKLICGACYEEDDEEITLVEPEASADQQEAA